MFTNTSPSDECHKPAQPTASPEADKPQDEVQRKQTKHEAENGVQDTAMLLFADGQPKDALEGIGSGVRNVLAGIGGGLVAGVAAPVMGYKTEGGTGLLKGAAVGLAALATMPLAGLYTGARQVARGVRNTGTALGALHDGDKMWDSNREQWRTVRLAEEQESVPMTDDDLATAAHAAYQAQEQLEATLKKTSSSDAGSAAVGGGGGGGTTMPSASSSLEATAAETYYDLLGVPKTATSAAIRKAYLQKALEMHPDKNPDDPNATRKFQRLTRAYNVLSNAAARDQYDRSGCTELDGGQEAAAMQNPFKEMLGADFLEPLVGSLAFMRYFEPNTLYTTDTLRELDRRRRLRMAQQLARFLDEDAACDFAAARAALRDAVATPLGPVFVRYVANQYRVLARQHLHDSTLVRELDNWYSSKCITASATTGVLASGVRVMGAAVQRSLSETDALKLLAAANESDIRHAVQRACRLVLFDAGVSAAQRRRRAERLADLARVALQEVDREEGVRAAHSPPIAPPSPSLH